MSDLEQSRELRAAINKAVDLAVKRRRLKVEEPLFGGDTFRINPWIAGRVVRDITLEQADELAVSLTKSVGKLGIGDLVPATVKIDDDILVGFIERDRFLVRQ